METLLNQLTQLPRKFLAAPLRTRLLGFGAVGVLVGLAALVSTTAAGDSYQYAFTNLAGEDGSEAGAVLKGSQIPYRLEAGGTALAVPANRVYEARLLLATAGLPHAGGTGFELFDRGDLGVSEFTQQVNLRRATEGELARTVSRLNGVRSARVHLTLPERGLFRDEKRVATAAVVLNLQPGHRLGERELAGVKHLIASAVPSLQPSAVTIVDGQGAVLSSEDAWGEDTAGYGRKLERDLEQRVIGMLEPVVGVGQVVARVSAVIDATEVNTVSDVFDPDATALKTEHTSSGNQSQDSTRAANVAGAAANQPLAPAAGATGGGSKGASTSQEETRTFEVSKTTTRSVARSPRLVRLSAAVLLDGKDGKPRADAEVTRLGELARRAVGFETQRGDQLDISSSVFAHAGEDAPVAAAAVETPKLTLYAAVAVGALLLAAVLFFALRRSGSKQPEMVLQPGMKVAQIEAAATVGSPLVPAAGASAKALPDPALGLRERARTLALSDPGRAAHLLRAWISDDTESKEASRG